jgi:NADH-quinone oxidoreductase subunit F
MDFLATKAAYINFNRDYYTQTRDRIDPLLESCRARGYLITVFQEEPSYIGGESGALLNAIEGRKTQPRVEPPSPSIRGIHGVPTLVHNVETLYDVARVSLGIYQPTRHSTILGVAHEGVYAVPNEASVAEILRQTANYPDFPFFVQVGGGASGEIIRAEQAETAQLQGCGSIEVYPASTSAYFLLDKLSRFYAAETCGKCAPCREGSAAIRALVEQLDPTIADSDIPWAELWPLVKLMEKASLCGLGRSIALPLRSYAENILRIPSYV